MATSINAQKSERLCRLLGYLDKDPDNPDLTADAAQLAFEERAFDLARALIAHYRTFTDLTPGLLNLEGLVELGSGDAARAASIFQDLCDMGHDDPSLRFNLAWSEALLGHYDAVAELIDEAVLAASPRAPALRIQMLHHLERFEEGLAAGPALVARFPDDQALKGALALLALDADDITSARRWAEDAPVDPDAQTVLALLNMDDGSPGDAGAVFDSILAIRPNSPRALVGKGLDLLANGNAADAAVMLDRGAGVFEDHLGSWIAAGWAYFISGDLRQARDRFLLAAAIDGAFAESYGGLAVVDIAGGQYEAASKNCEIALKLDPMSLGGTLARTMLFDKAGKKDEADRLRAAALSMPLGPGGKTIAQALASFARTRGS